jgi:hypothetical protein
VIETVVAVVPEFAPVIASPAVNVPVIFLTSNKVPEEVLLDS